MIRKSYFNKSSQPANQEEQLRSLRDFQSLWEMFKEIISTGDTFVFDPKTPKQLFKDYWFASYMQTFVYENQQGQIMGAYLVKPNQPDLGSHVANASFMVHPKFQGKGIGKKLCEHCLQMAKQLGFKAMQFNIVVSTNKPAVALWKKCGFQIVGTIPEAFNNLKQNRLVDAFIMYKKL